MNVIWIALIKSLVIMHINNLTMYLLQYKSYFGPDGIKDSVKHLLELETKNNFKLKNPKIFNKEIKI